MQWPKLEFSKSQVSKAGHILATGPKDFEEFSWAEDVLNNWRSCHGRPINTFQSTLRDKLAAINVNNAIVAQRLKRTPSIISKLKRFKAMKLSTMHDIGGLRAVVPNTKKSL
jgi:(p)ppGpp synthase/HD superfamily hydrolase